MAADGTITGAGGGAARRARRGGALVVLLLFLVALLLLHRSLRGTHYHDVVEALRLIPSWRVVLALLLTALSYFTLTFYDLLAFRYLHRPFDYIRIAFSSFVCYAFASSTGGLAIIASGGIRYHLYAGWGLSAAETARVVLFNIFTFWTGYLALAGALFLASPPALPAALHLPFSTLRPLGALFASLAAAYFIANSLRKKTLFFRSWEFAPAGPGLAAAQTLLACVDWSLAGGVLYVLLPPSPGFGFPAFLGVYLLAQIAGLASTVPGGLGVFESVMLLLLAPHIPPPSVVGSLLVFRGVYYLLPLGAAALSLGLFEALGRKRPTARLLRGWSASLSSAVPGMLALAALVSGAVLLLSGSTPAASGRLARLTDHLPLTVIEISHFMASLAGAGLLLLARGLQRRLDGAYYLAALLLGSGALLSLLRGLDYEAAGVLLVMLAALLPSRRHFYRRAALLDEPLSAWWISSMAIVLASSSWLVLFSYRHVQYSHDLWWRFAVEGHAPRSLRAAVGAGSLVLLFSAARLLRPSPPRPSPPSPDDLAQAAVVASRSRETYAFLALLGDKSLLFNERRDTFLMYAVQGRSWVALRDPVGDPLEARELLWRFVSLCDRYGGRPVLYQAGESSLATCLDLGTVPLKIGEEARLPLEKFSLEGASRRGLRHTRRQVERAGGAFEVVPAAAVPGLLPELREISDEWLREKSTREKGFSLGFFDESYLSRFPMAVVRAGGKTAAFANLWPGAQGEELSVDLMRYRADAPHGVMDYLFTEVMLWGRAEGYRWFNLGMAPLTGIEVHRASPLWNRVASFVYRHGEHFYNFQGLRGYKEKFDPVWQPKYLAAPGGLSLPAVLTDIAALTSRGLGGIAAK